MPGNYRPIAIIPVLCKLYSRVVLGSMAEKIESLRTPEEIGFRRNYQCSGLIHVLRLLGEKANEWGETVWMASLDLEKAFDKLVHTAVFTGLRRAGIDNTTVEAIRELYTNQTAYVQLDEHTKSRLIDILRGVRQGDLMSPALFANSVRACMETLRAKWEKEQLGTTIGADSRGKSRLSYIMFADDTTIIAKSKQALRKMLTSLAGELAQIGLTMNADKCKIQCSKPRPQGDDVLTVGQMRIPIVSRDEGFKILGTMFTLNGKMEVEFKRRQDAAWAKFHELAPVLLKRDGNLKKRLQLFQSTVSQTLLWGSESWTLTVKQKRQLRSVQRNMLRRMVGIRRRPDEDYVSWIKRATTAAEDHARMAGAECWVRGYLRRKWQWAGRIARMDKDRWAIKVTAWRAADWSSWQLVGASAYGARPIRSRPGHYQRWETELCRFMGHLGGHLWQDMADNSDMWQSQAEHFVDFCWR